MKDKQIIEKLQLLRSVKPDDETLRLIHKKSTSQLFGENNYSTRKWFSLASLIPFAAFAAVLIFLSVMTGFLPGIIHNSIIVTEISFAPNHYIKAKLAVANAEDQFAIYKQQPDANKLSALTQSLALANTQMTKLQLVGEKGKYSMKDCLTLYTSYHNSLETIKKTLSSQTIPSNEKGQFLRKINQYDEQAERKLHLYK